VCRCQIHTREQDRLRATRCQQSYACLRFKPCTSKYIPGPKTCKNPVKGGSYHPPRELQQLQKQAGARAPDPEDRRVVEGVERVVQRVCGRAGYGHGLVDDERERKRAASRGVKADQVGEIDRSTRGSVLESRQEGDAVPVCRDGLGSVVPGAA
jgi:hypothetical protein